MRIRCLPVISRELIAQARQPATHWLRVVGAGVLTAAFWLALNRHQHLVQFAPIALGGAGVQLAGGTLFGGLNLAIFLTLWLGVPLLTADAISRERREGTLGLLLLTPLRPAGVVLGKATVHILRALTLYLTMLPWLILPVMLGGVGWADVAMAALVNAGILLVALAAGLLATTWSEDWVKTALLAEALSLVLGIVFLALYQAIAREVLAPWTTPPTPPGGAFTIVLSPTETLVFSPAAARIGTPFFPVWSGYGVPTWLARFSILLGFATNGPMGTGGWTTGTPFGQNGWSVIWASYPPAAHAAWFAAVGGLVAGSLLACGLAISMAARRVAASWRDQPRSRTETEVRRLLFTPRLWPTVFRSRAARALNRNPIGWLQQRSAQARLVKWGWCAFASFLVIALAGEAVELRTGLVWLQQMVLVGLAFSAAASFRHERESGAIELLLVTPLSPDRIIVGRLRGLWMQFLPAALVVLFAAGYLGSIATPGSFGPGGLRSSGIPWPAFVAGYLSLPVWGLLFSMRRLPFLGAWLATCVVGFGAPWLVVGLLPILTGLLWAQGPMVGGSPFSHLPDPPGLRLATGVASAALAWYWLRRSLRRRDFVLRGQGTRE